MSSVGPLSGHGLVLPSDPVDEQRTVARAYTRYLAGCCQRFLAVAAYLPPALHGAHAHIAALVRQAIERGQQELMLSCFAAPAVGTPLQCVELRDDLPAFQARIDAAAAAMLPHILFEMQLHGLIPDGESVLWEHGAPPLASFALGGELQAPDGASGWRFSASHLTAVAGAAELERLPVQRDAMSQALVEDACGFRFEPRFWRVGHGAHLATVDHNPMAAFEAHPDKAGNHVDLGGRSEDDWLAMLDESFALVERFLPGEFAEMGVLLREIVPVGYDDVRHLSASYREAVGTVYLTLHPNVMTMTEALIHEFQHNKFNVAAYGATFLNNAFQPLYKSPIRPDPRPLWGIVLAVHAFLPVAELYRRMRDAEHPFAGTPEFERRMTEIDLKNHEGMDMLRAHADFTAAGRALFDDLEALERRHLDDRTARGLDNTPSDVHVA
ncbi:MAG: HEXXH motif-containing putative peptide modification protein [bacterium]